MNKKDPVKITMKNIKKDDKILRALADNGKKTDWKRYYDLEPLHRMKNEGRELLGEYIVLTEKRDGENVSLSLNEKLEAVISSHNQETADSHIANRFRATPEFIKATQLLKDEQVNYGGNFVLYGELMMRVCPTRIEPNKKNLHWILFDIYDKTEGKYLSYNSIYQKAYHYKIPIVKQLDAFIPKNMDEINTKVSEWLKWCVKHRREGIVGKSYRNQSFFKEKIDLPKKIKLVKPNQNEIMLPVMPEERIIRALQHAWDVVGEDNWKNISKAMPEVAKQLSNEAREHFYSVPHNMYKIYTDTPIDKIKPQVQPQ